MGIGRPPNLNSKLKSEDPQPRDARDGQWSPGQLQKMDANFRQRVERAFKRGTERPDAAANMWPTTHLK